MLVYYIFVFFVCQVFFVVSCEFRFNKVYPTGKLQTQIRFTLRFIPYRRLHRHFQPLLSLCDISSVSTEEFIPEEGSVACRFATTPVSTEEFAPKKGNNMFFHTSEEESGVCRFAVTSALSPIVGFAATSPEGGSDVCRFAVTSALSPIVGFAATSPEGGSDACRFATTPVSTEKFTPEGGSDVCRLAIYFRFSGFRENFENKFFNYNSKIFTLP